MGCVEVEKIIYPKDKTIIRCCGIYVLKNLKSGKIYVGSSKNVAKRISRHIYLLKNLKHYNNHLQQAFNKSDSVFEIILLEKCIKENLISREIYWIEFYGSQNNKIGYNQCDVSINGGNIVTNKTRSKISHTLLGNKNIWMCDKKNMERITKFESLFQAAEHITKSEISNSNQFIIRMKISEAARNKNISTGNGRKAKRSSAYGYKWEVV
jgi:group I intron endonuclease